MRHYTSQFENFYRPYRAWMICWTITQGGTDFVSLALGYCLSGFQSLQIGCSDVH